MRNAVVWSLIMLFFWGCVETNPPIKVEQLTAQAPQQGHASVTGQRTSQIGEILPMGINVANGTDKRFHLDPTQIFAVTTDGRRIVPVPLSEAIRLSRNSASLGAEIKSGLATGLVGAAAGAAAGAAGEAH